MRHTFSPPPEEFQMARLQVDTYGHEGASAVVGDKVMDILRLCFFYVFSCYNMREDAWRGAE